MTPVGPIQDFTKGITHPPAESALEIPVWFKPTLRPALRRNLWVRHAVRIFVKKIRTKSRQRLADVPSPTGGWICLKGEKDTVRVLKAERQLLFHKLTNVWLGVIRPTQFRRRVERQQTGGAQSFKMNRRLVRYERAGDTRIVS